MVTDAPDIARRLLKAIERFDIKAFSELIADEFVMVFPFAPPGLPRRCIGKQQCILNIDSVGKMLSRISFLDVEFFSAADDLEIVFGRARSEALTALGVPYSNDYCFIFRIRNGLVYEHHEYFDPIRVMAAFSAELSHTNQIPQEC